MDKQVTSTPPIPGNGGVLVTCIYISSSSSKIVYLSVTSQIYTNKTYSKTKDIRDPA